MSLRARGRVSRPSGGETPPLHGVAISKRKGVHYPSTKDTFRPKNNDYLLFQVPNILWHHQRIKFPFEIATGAVHPRNDTTVSFFLFIDWVKRLFRRETDCHASLTGSQ